LDRVVPVIPCILILSATPNARTVPGWVDITAALRFVRTGGGKTHRDCPATLHCLATEGGSAWQGNVNRNRHAANASQSPVRNPDRPLRRRPQAGTALPAPAGPGRDAARDR